MYKYHSQYVFILGLGMKKVTVCLKSAMRKWCNFSTAIFKKLLNSCFLQGKQVSYLISIFNSCNIKKDNVMLPYNNFYAINLSFRFQMFVSVLRTCTQMTECMNQKLWSHPFLVPSGEQAVPLKLCYSLIALFADFQDPALLLANYKQNIHNVMPSSTYFQLKCFALIL